MRFSELPLVVRMVSVVLTMALAAGVWRGLYAIAQTLPVWANGALFAAFMVPAIVGLIWDYRRNRLARSAKKQGYTAEALDEYRNTGILTFAPFRRRSILFYLAAIWIPIGLLVAVVSLGDLFP